MEVRSSDNLYWDRYPYVWLSIWRFNGTGYHQVRQFVIRRGPLCRWSGCHHTSQSDEVLQSLGEISPPIDVLANDMIGFHLPDLRGTDDFNIYRHLPLLYKPGPTPGTFIPIVSAKVTASSTTSEECMPNYIYSVACRISCTCIGILNVDHNVI